MASSPRTVSPGLHTPVSSPQLGGLWQHLETVVVGVTVRLAGCYWHLQVEIRGADRYTMHKAEWSGPNVSSAEVENPAVCTEKSPFTTPSPLPHHRVTAPSLTHMVPDL